MIENRKILKILIIIIVVMLGLELLIGIIDMNNSVIQSLSNIVLGILTSSIVSAIMTFVAYKYKYEELKENLIKNLLEIYSKFVFFKCCYKECQNKNGKIINNANGLNNQKDFIKSYNKMLEKVRQYLDKFCVKKYEVNYKLLKEIDNKHEDITSESKRKIKYKNDNLS